MEEVHHVRKERHRLFGVLEASLTDIESIEISADKLFRVERGIPGLEQDVAQDHIAHISICDRFGNCLSHKRRRRGYGHGRRMDGAHGKGLRDLSSDADFFMVLFCEIEMYVFDKVRWRKKILYGCLGT